MPRRIEQLNEQLRKGLAELILRYINLPNGLITVIYVDCSSDLKYAKIAVSVLPESRAEKAIVILRKHSRQFSQILRKKLTIRQIPKFNWIIDRTESQAAEIEQILKKISAEGGSASG